jgi:hypothetical protein
MMVHSPWKTLGLGLLLVSCGGGTAAPAHVEISGKVPAEAGQIAGSAVCMHESQCGAVTIAGAGGGAAGGSGSDAGFTSTCTGTIAPIPYAKCLNEASADITRLLGCPALTPADVDTLEVCFDTLVAETCVTQAEADAMARAAESGTDPPQPDLPAACALLRQPPAGCPGPAPIR